MMKRRFQKSFFKTTKRCGSNKSVKKRKVAMKQEAQPIACSFSERFWALFCKIVSLFIFWRKHEANSLSKCVNITNITERMQLLEAKVLQLSKQIKILQKEKQQNLTLSTVPIPPPVPPPPPPPALLPGTKVASSVSKPTLRTSELSVLPRVGISASELKKVKLKKSVYSGNTCNSKQPSALQLITPHDLQNIRLKKRDPNCGKENKKFLPTPKMSGMPRTLKKTNIVRSPGGTPMMKRDIEHSTGTGLTPIFTQALRKKFQSFNKTSPVNEASPGWRC